MTALAPAGLVFGANDVKMPAMPWRFVVPILVLLAPLAADAEKIGKAPEIIGKAKVIDGDTIEIDGKQIHLYGIDAPEIGQTCWFQRGEFACGKSARQSLWVYVKDQELTCREQPAGARGGSSAICFAEGRDLGEHMVRRGWALSEPKRGEAYLALEDEARRQKLGLWNFKFTKPWDWRAMMRKAK